MAGDPQSLLPVSVEPEFCADGDGNFRHSPFVAGGVRVVHLANDCGDLDGAHKRGFELLEVTPDLLVCAFFLRDVLQQADDRGPARVRRASGIRAGKFRLITAWPFPAQRIRELAGRVKAFVVPELNLGQMVLEVERAAAGQAKVIPVSHAGGTVHNPDTILNAIVEAAR